MKMPFPSREQVEFIRKNYPPGTRVMLNNMNDPYSPESSILSAPSRVAIYRAYPPTDLPPVPGFRYLNFVTSLGIYLSLLKVKGILKGVNAVAALDLSNAGTPELFQLLPANVAGSGDHIHGNRLLHRQLEQNAADPVVTVIHNTLDRGRNDLGQIIAAILRGNIANVKMDCFLDELS